MDEFSKSMATEVRMLLNEVGQLREERQDLQQYAFSHSIWRYQDMLTLAPQ